MALSIGSSRRVSQYLKLLLNCQLEPGLLNKHYYPKDWYKCNGMSQLQKLLQHLIPRFTRVQSWAHAHSNHSEEHLFYLHRHIHCAYPMSCGTLSKAAVPCEAGNVCVLELR